MRILIIPHLPTLYGRRYQLAKHLSKNNEVYLITWSMPYPFTINNLLDSLLNSFKSNSYKKERINILKIKRFPFFLPYFNRYLFQKQIENVFTKNKIDIIISQTYFNEVKPPTNLPLIYDFNDYHPAFAQIYGSLLYKLGFFILQVNKTMDDQISRAKGVVVVSDYLYKYASKLNKNVYKLPNGVEQDYINHSKTTEKVNKYSIVYISNFGKWSKLQEIIYVINKLRVEFPQIKLTLIGNGTEINSAKKLVNKLILEKNVVFLGKINDRSKLIQITKKHSICLNISDNNFFRNSASPIKYFEYSALQKIIISTELNEIKKLNFPNTYFVKENVFENNLSLLIKNIFKTNPKTSNTHKYMSKYTWENIINKYQTLIEKSL